MTTYNELPELHRRIIDATTGDSPFGAMMRSFLMGPDQPVEPGKPRFTGLPSVTREDDGQMYICWNFVRRDGMKIYGAFTGATMEDLKGDLCGILAHVGLNPYNPVDAEAANGFFRTILNKLNIYHGPARSLQKELRGMLKAKLAEKEDDVTDWKSGTEKPADVPRPAAVFSPRSGGSSPCEQDGQRKAQSGSTDPLGEGKE